MPDDIEYISFDNDVLQTTTTNGTAQTANVTGAVEVDYTTGTVSTVNGDSVNVTGSTGPNTSFDHAYGLYNSPLTNPPGTDTYEITFSGGTATQPSLEVTYNGQTPTQASDVVFNSDPGEADNVQYSSIGNAPLTSSTTSPVTCFVTGTAITTESGPIAVEHLAVGDMILTTSGAFSEIRWIGHRTLDCRRHARPAEIMPVRIAAHAFGVDMPRRDLLVSPGHAICVDVGGETLIPASALVNGTTIVQLDVDTVTYWHVELEAHDVLFAQNLPCESYLDMGNRGFFVESGVVDLAAAPDAPVRTHADFCRPYHDGGAVIEAVRARLAALAASPAQVKTARVAA